MTWLDDNGDQQDEESVPILQQYLDEDHVFAAVKLTDGAGLGEIHPIVLRFAGDEACVPIRLTRIAAVEDMEIRTFFLSRARVAPRNYRHVLVNPLKIDWPNQATNYKEAITLAVDAESADGFARSRPRRSWTRSRHKGFGAAASIPSTSSRSVAFKTRSCSRS